MKVSIIIPAFNEAETIKELIERIKALKIDSEIILVDDASTDETSETVKDTGIKIIKHPYRRGNGAAVKTGIRHSSGENIVFIDADLQHPPEKITDLVEKLNKYDMVVASRTSKSKVSIFRAFGNWVLIKVAEYLSQQKIPDLTSGYRAVKSKYAKEFLHLLPNGFSYPTTLTLAMLKSGYFVDFVPVESIKMREKGKSKIQPFKNGFEFILLIMRLIMLFDPLRIFLPISILSVITGLSLLVYQIIIFNSVKGGSVLAILVGIFSFFFGLLADQSAAMRREIRKNV